MITQTAEMACTSAAAALQAIQRLYAILAPENVAATERLSSGKSKLVHYTSGANALNIIKSKVFWLRNVRCMNDYSEVQHGLNLLLRVFTENEGARRERFLSAFGKCGRAAAQEAIARFDKIIPDLPMDTYIGCLSEHASDSPLGRLSMWRAYGASDGGVAIFMNSTPFMAETDLLKAYSVPVSYVTDDEFREGLDQVIGDIEKAEDYIKCLEPETISDLVFWWLLFKAVSLKHPAFREEREWRIIYIPTVEQSDVIKAEVETVNGTPQIVQKIPLLNNAEKGLVGANLDALINRLIIGPSQFPVSIRDAFDAALTAEGVQDAWKRVKMSLIPLRT
jgi:hypothetical protein